MKFKKLKVSSTKTIANKTGNRIAKQKLKEASKDLKTAAESFVKIHLPEQKPSSIVKYLLPKPSPKPIARKTRSFQKRKPITSTPHFQLTNHTNEFSNAGSSTLSPIIREELASERKKPISPKKTLDESDSEIEGHKLRKKRRDSVVRVNASSDIVFLDNTSDGAKSKKAAKKQKNCSLVAKKPQNSPSNQLPSPTTELKVMLKNVTPRDRSEFVNTAPRSAGRLNYTKERDIEVYAKSIGLRPVSPPNSDLTKSPSSPRPRYDFRSSKVTNDDKAHSSANFHEAGPTVARNLLEDLLAEKSQIDIPDANNRQEDKNNESPMKKAKPNPPQIESESDNRLTKKRKAPTNKNLSKIKIIENVTFVKARKDNEKPVESNDKNNDETDRPPPLNLIEEIGARKLQKQMPVEEDSETSSSDDGSNSKETSRNANVNAGPSNLGNCLPNQNELQQTNQEERLVGKNSIWKVVYKELNTYAKTVTDRGEVLLSESSGVSKESEDLFSEVGRIKKARKSKSKKEKMKKLENAVKKLQKVKKKSKLVDQQIQTERLSAPIFRQSTVEKNKKSKSRILDLANISDISSKSPNIYDSLEQGNEIDALGFSNFDEPMLSLKHKPFRFDTPSRSLGHLSWSNSNDIVLPNYSSDSDSSCAIGNNLSPKAHNNVAAIKKYNKNKTQTSFASANRRKSKLVQPTQILRSSANKNDKLVSPRPMTRSLARTISENNSTARKKLDFNQTGDKSQVQDSIEVDRDNQASKKRQNKSLERKSAQQMHYSIILQSPQFDKEISKNSNKYLEIRQNSVLKSPRNKSSLEKSSSSKNLTLEPPQFSRQAVTDMLRSATSIENLQQSSRNLNSSSKRQQLDDENQEISNRKKQQSRDSANLGISKQNKSISKALDSLRNNQDEVLESSYRSNKQQRKSTGSNLGNSFVPESSAKARKQQKNSSKQPLQNVTLREVDDLENNQVSAIQNEIHTKSHQQSVDVYMDNEIAEPSFNQQNRNNSKQNTKNSSAKVIDKENQTLEGEIPTSTKRSTKKKNNNKKSQALKDKTPRNNNENSSRATRGKAKKDKNSRITESHLDEALILPEPEGRRVLRERKPPRYCPTIDFASTLNKYAMSPRLFKKLNPKAAELVKSFTESKSRKSKTSRTKTKVKKSTLGAINEQPIAEENDTQPLQEEQQNVSDSVLMPPPAINMVKPRERKDSVADSGFTSISGQKKVATKSSRGKKTSKAAKKVEEEVPTSIEPALNDSPQCTDQIISSINESEGQSVSGSEKTYFLYQTIDGKLYKTQFACSQPPSLLNYTSVANLFVNEIAKDPNDQYTVGYLRLLQGESKKVASSKKYSFTYVVIKGVAEVTVENEVCTIYQGGTFCVPVGMIYSIKNISLDSYLEINFTRIRSDSN